MKNNGFLKASLAAMLLVAVVSSGIAMATHSFTDVPDDAFYTDAVAWAKANGMTTGSPAGADTFKPLDGVTRGENITFAKRYDDFVVQPALAALEAQVAPLTNSVAAFVGGELALSIPDNTDVVGKSISLTAPAEGILLVTATADVQATAPASTPRCSLTTGTAMDFGYADITNIATSGDQASMALTRGYAVASGETTTINLVCDAFSGSFTLRDAAMTAVFAPT